MLSVQSKHKKGNILIFLFAYSAYVKRHKDKKEQWCFSPLI